MVSVSLGCSILAANGSTGTIFNDETKNEAGLFGYIGNVGKRILKSLETAKQIGFRIQSGKIACDSAVKPQTSLFSW